ncbi:MAG: hypothetical protein EPN79_11475 [Burkholderiaceae bacterium]|nr:MAG: hypothetical protein EPN79_11475 [Burkholderiaceae bacterium]TBR76695.1 MAG: hypothetical protein EPN64_05590 [Burkholderiaceae bacterium]
MNNEKYEKFERVAVPAMKIAMIGVYKELRRLGIEGEDIEDVEQLDLDVERGVCILIHRAGAETPFAIELLLTDGDERGFTALEEKEGDEHKPACGLLMTVTGPGGSFLGQWSPYNFTGQVGTCMPEEIVRRVHLMDHAAIATSVRDKIFQWEAEQAQGRAPRA